MPESPEITNQRRQVLCLLTLIEQAAHTARVALCASDDLMTRAEGSKVALARADGKGGYTAQDDSAVLQSQGDTLFQAHNTQVAKIVMHTQRLGVLVGMIQVGSPGQQPPAGNRAVVDDLVSRNGTDHGPVAGRIGPTEG